MRRLGFRLLFGMTLLGMPVCAQDIPVVDTDSLATDSLAIDSLNMDPEWYVAPLVREADFAPRRAAAANCPVDSVLTFNVDSILSEVTVYEYGDTTRTMVWTVNADGSRIGKSRTESASTATTSYSATFAWDITTNDWIGSTKTEYVYNASNKMTTNTTFDWGSNDWLPLTRYTYDYDVSNREIEYIVYNRGTDNLLKPSQRRIKEYNAAGKITLDLQYGSYVNDAWVPSSKLIYDYDAAGNQILKENYSSYTNGAWVGSAREVWTYNAKKSKTLYAKQTWMNGTWSNSSKEVYEYNAANKQTLKIVYTGSGTTWTESTKEVSDYNAAGSKTLSAKYKWKNGAWVGNGSRTETEYVGSKQSVVVTSSWSTAVADWIYATRHSYTYDGAGKTIADTTKTYTNSAWVNNALVTHAFDDKGNDTLAVTSAWNGTDWTAASITKGTYTYTASGLPLLAETYTGLGEVWIGNQKIEYAYNEAGSQTLYISYDWYNGDWRGKQKTEKEYDANNRLILSENYTWRNSAWAGNNKYEYAYDTYGRQCMTAQYTWSNNDWKGLSKTEQTMDANGVVHTSISYTWRENDWVGTFKYDYTYDNAGHTTDKVIYYFQNNQWGNDQRYTYAFDARGQEIYSHEYRWVNGNWQMISAHEKTYDEADNKLRREITGSWSTNGNVSSYTDKQYSYACDPRYYTIRFVNYDGTELSSESIVEGETPSYKGEEPTKQEDAEYTYSFDGWTPSIIPVTANATYTATFTGTKRTYTITWLNEDGTQLGQETLEYGATPAHADMSKDNTAEYTYNFTGWKPGIGIVTGDATYTADFDSIKNKYTVIFRNYDEAELQSSEVEYGVMPNFEGEAPTKPADAQDTYNFAGWDPQVVPVIGNATYTAQYTSTVNSYTIKFMNGDTELQSTEVAYGEMPVYEGATPTKDATAQYTYDFSGWDSEIVAVTGEKTYNATFSSTVNSYVITFMNGEDILQSGEVAYGETPSYTGETPTKPADAQDTYTFLGWSPEIVSVTGTATYTATFIGTTNKYLITFKNGETELQSSEVDYGETPVYTGATPTKAATAQYTYTFSGWDPAIVAVTGIATYEAQFSSTVNKYTITWVDENDTEISHETLEYGATPSHADAEKENTAEWTYNFEGWTPAIVEVSGDATYKATFSQTKNSYTITWVDENDIEISHETLEYGATPSHADASKDNTAEWTYSFTGWSPAIVDVTGDATYKATFSQTKNTYTITFLNYDGTELQTGDVEYGVVPTYTSATPTKPADAQGTYTFAGWDEEIAAVTGAKTYTATFTGVKGTYTITFYFGDGVTILEQMELAYGEMPEMTLEPARLSDPEFSYTFAGWEPAIAPVTADADYVAVYTATTNSYTIIFRNDDGTELQRDVLDYGILPIYAGEEPTKEEDERYTYEFAGWKPAVDIAKADAVYTATYTATKKKKQGVEDVVEAGTQATKIYIEGNIYILRAGHAYAPDGTKLY